MSSPVGVAGSTIHWPINEPWLATLSEEIIDPDLPIIDAHHHLMDRPLYHYLLPEFLADVNSGHNVKATVFVQASAMYRADGPVPYRTVGETEFVNGCAAMSASGLYGPTRACAGIVSHVDLLLGDGARPVLEAHVAAGNGRFRGIRHSAARDASPEVRTTSAIPPEGLLADAAFRKGFAALAPLGLSFDAWVYHRRSVRFAIWRGLFLKHESSSIISAVPSVSVLMRTGARKCSPTGEPRSASYPPARTSSSKWAGWRCASADSISPITVSRRRRKSSPPPFDHT